MLQDPVAHEKLNPDRAAITNDQLDLYNMAAMEVHFIHNFLYINCHLVDLQQSFNLQSFYLPIFVLSFFYIYCYVFFHGNFILNFNVS